MESKTNNRTPQKTSKNEMDITFDLSDIPQSSDIKYNWTDEDENFLRGLSEEAICYQFLNDYSAQQYTLRVNIITGVALVLNLITTFSGLQNQYDDINIRNNIGICLTLVGGFGTLIQLINTKCNISDDKIKYEKSYKNWKKFSFYINVELIKNRTERIDKNIFFPKCIKLYDQLIETQITFTEKAINVYYKKYEKINIQKPSTFGDFKPLDINRQFVESKSKQNEVKTLIIDNYKQINGRIPNDEELADILSTEPLYFKYNTNNLNTSTNTPLRNTINFDIGKHERIPGVSVV